MIGSGRRRYVGATVDLARRLRQHNRGIAGGARATGRAPPGSWSPVLVVGGFHSWREALRAEWRIKRACQRRGRGPGAAVPALCDVLAGRYGGRWTSRSERALADGALTVRWAPGAEDDARLRSLLARAGWRAGEPLGPPPPLAG